MGAVEVEISGAQRLTTTYYFAGGQRIAMRKDGEVTYLHGDHLGSASLATNASGARLSDMRRIADDASTPFGEVRYGDAPTDRRFTGQREENGIGLYDYGARFYSASLGRFLSADRIVPRIRNPQSLNMKIMRTETIIVITVILLSVSVLCCVSPRMATSLWSNGIEQAARRVNRDPTLTGLADYIIDEIHTGMSQSETEAKLQALAPIKVIPRHALQDVGSGYGPTSCDEIQVKLTSLPGHTWPIMACYNAQGELVILHSVDSESFPALDIYAPIHPNGELFKP